MFLHLLGFLSLCFVVQLRFRITELQHLCGSPPEKFRHLCAALLTITLTNFDHPADIIRLKKQCGQQIGVVRLERTESAGGKTKSRRKLLFKLVGEAFEIFRRSLQDQFH